MLLIARALRRVRAPAPSPTVCQPHNEASNSSVSPECTSSPVVGPGVHFTDHPGPSWMCGALTATYAKKGFRVASGSASTSLIHASEVLPMTEVE